jgi:hypothetical protein
MRWWLVILALIFGGLLAGAVLGVRYSDTVEDIPVPADGTGCAIAEQVLPKPPYGDLLPVEVEVDWNASSVWVGIISGQERDRLIAASALDSDVVVDCDPETISFLAGGPDAQSQTGFIWTLHEDDRYAITGEVILVDDDSGGVLDGVLGEGEGGPLVTVFDLNVEARAAARPTLIIGLGILEGLTVLAAFGKAAKGVKA